MYGLTNWKEPVMISDNINFCGQPQNAKRDDRDSTGGTMRREGAVGVSSCEAVLESHPGAVPLNAEPCRRERSPSVTGA